MVSGVSIDINSCDQSLDIDRMKSHIVVYHGTKWLFFQSGGWCQCMTQTVPLRNAIARCCVGTLRAKTQFALTVIGAWGTTVRH
ncbi:hypothetical protein Plhal703r1_c02g0010241 [Plasmopara halstedii]